MQELLVTLAAEEGETPSPLIPAIYDITWSAVCFVVILFIFWRVVLPQCGNGMLTAGTLAWARSLGEFGPLLIFAGATRMKTEVLSTTVFLELSIGNLEGAVAVSLLMVACAVLVLVIARIWGSRGLSL